MIGPITSEKQITPEWLSTRLRQTTGAVVKIGITHSTTLFSDIFRLEVTYSGDTQPTLPHQYGD